MKIQKKQYTKKKQRNLKTEQLDPQAGVEWRMILISKL